MTLRERLSHAWNALTSSENRDWSVNSGPGSSGPNYHGNSRRYTPSSYSAAIFNRIALDVSQVSIQHVVVDDKEDQKPVTDGLNYCLNVEANLDQSHIAFIQDLVYSMFDEGCVAVVPVDTSIKPIESGAYDILSMRVGRITQWFPKHVSVRLYNEATGIEEEITISKSLVAIIENPLYAVVNGQNSTFKRLMSKLAMIDDLDALLASGQLDLLIQLPYAVKSELQKTQAKERMENLEEQLKNGKRGLAYIDGTEKVTQLNRPVTATVLDEIKLLTDQFYNQMGLTANVFNGTASEAEMRNYYSRSIDPMIGVIIAEFTRKFFTKTAITKGHKLVPYRDPFKLVPIEQIGTIADTFRRNAILTSNEIRKIVGVRPSNEASADVLYNPNLTKDDQITAPSVNLNKDAGSLTPPDEEDESSQNE
ncbi:MAG: phage portal protein [Anaerorhabdus sp.]|uniref:phage portal protein n=1 Tax=Anaerorhabdus sp. TaxID=1872524 RepID=UPI002FCC0D6E